MIELSERFVASAATKWRKTYRTAKRCGWTFRQAASMFRNHYGFFPLTDGPLMPIDEIDWFRLVRDVPIENLVQAKQPLAEA
jgi:hypothetical protein